MKKRQSYIYCVTHRASREYDVRVTRYYPNAVQAERAERWYDHLGLRSSCVSKVPIPPGVTPRAAAELANLVGPTVAK